MSVPDDHSYFSRFLLKFIEIIAAGLATAVSGYLIAHLSGVLSSPAPAPAAAVIQAVPTASVLFPPQPIPPISANVNEPQLAPQELVTPPRAQPARKTANTPKTEPPRKHSESATNAAESPHDRGFINLFRRRRLDQNAVDLRIAIQFFDSRQQFALGGRSRKLELDRMQSKLAAHLVLRTDVGP